MILKASLLSYSIKELGLVEYLFNYIVLSIYKSFYHPNQIFISDFKFIIDYFGENFRTILCDINYDSSVFKKM